MAATYREAAALPDAGEHEVNDTRYCEAITTIMTRLATRGDVVIIGRGSQAILRDCPGALHVAVTAPFAVRVQRVAERDGVPPAKAKEAVVESDRGRMDYHHKYFKMDPMDPTLYDVVINTARVSQKDAAQLIVAAVRTKTPPAQKRE